MGADNVLSCKLEFTYYPSFRVPRQILHPPPDKLHNGGCQCHRHVMLGDEPAQNRHAMASGLCDQQQSQIDRGVMCVCVCVSDSQRHLERKSRLNVNNVSRLCMCLVCFCLCICVRVCTNMFVCICTALGIIPEPLSTRMVPPQKHKLK